jgi:FAD/FMN-containing dehydrogenase
METSMTPATQTPPGWPAGIPIVQEQYLNWSWEINVQSSVDLHAEHGGRRGHRVQLGEGHNYKVRARGIMHGWSPLTIVGGTSPGANIILVDLTRNLAAMTFIPRTAISGPQVKVGTGATMLALLTFLEQQSGGQGAARGYSFPHTPAPGNLTLGGVLAINAHGTAIPSAGDSFPCSYGSLSNQILAFTAVVTDPKSGNPNQYSLRTFTRAKGTTSRS